MNKLIVEILKIEGTCPVYKVGDRIVSDEGYKLSLKETDRVCMHSFSFDNTLLCSFIQRSRS